MKFLHQGKFLLEKLLHRYSRSIWLASNFDCYHTVDNMLFLLKKKLPAFAEAAGMSLDNVSVVRVLHQPCFPGNRQDKKYF